MTQKQALTPHLAAKHPRTPLAGPYGHPLHPLLVTIPIGAWSASLVFDLAAIFGSHPEAFTRGALWLIGIGVVGAILAAVLGLLDFSNLRSGTPAHRTGLIHLTINSVVLVLFIVGFLIRWGGDYGQVSVPGFIITIIALAMLGVSGWLAAGSPTASACGSPTRRCRPRGSVPPDDVIVITGVSSGIGRAAALEEWPA